MAEGVGVGLAFGVAEGVGVGLGLGVAVGVGLGLGVAVGVGLGFGVAVGAACFTVTSLVLSTLNFPIFVHRPKHA